MTSRTISPSLLLLLGLWGVTTLACATPLNVGVSSTMPPPPTAGGIIITTPTVKLVGTIAPATTTTIEALPTFTRRPGVTPSPYTTVAGEGTVTPVATMTPLSTVTSPPVEPGPLAFTYNVEWEISPSDSSEAVARVLMVATGGNGVYTYYHDDLLQPGPAFSFRWATCQPKPGSVRVDSSDGQSAKEDYFLTAPCPTP